MSEKKQLPEMSVSKFLAEKPKDFIKISEATIVNKPFDKEDKNGDPWQALTVNDGSGNLNLTVSAYNRLEKDKDYYFKEGEVVSLCGKYSIYNYKPQMELRKNGIYKVENPTNKVLPEKSGPETMGPRALYELQRSLIGKCAINMCNMYENVYFKLTGQRPLNKDMIEPDKLALELLRMGKEVANTQIMTRQRLGLLVEPAPKKEEPEIEYDKGEEPGGEDIPF